MSTSLRLALFDEFSGGTSLNLFQAWESSTSYISSRFTEQLVANSKQTVNGKDFVVNLRANPINFGRMSNYAEKKRVMTESKGYVLVFHHEVSSNNFKLESLTNYISMPMTMRGEKTTKCSYPFLLIGLVGPNQKEIFSQKEVAEWADKHLENWEYISIDILALSPVVLEQGQEVPKKKPRSRFFSPKLEDPRITALPAEALKQLQQEQKQKLQESMNRLIEKADKVILPEPQELTAQAPTTTAIPRFSTQMTFPSKQLVKPFQTPTVQAPASLSPSLQPQNTGKEELSSFQKFVHSVLLF